MALLKCPECQNEISSAAKMCPHCGAELSVCPDCNAVYVGKPQTCENCGFVFEKKADEQSEIVTSSDSHPMQEQWLDRAKQNQKIIKINKVIWTVLVFAGLVPAVTAIMLFLSWKNNGDLAVSASVTLNKIKTCFVAGCIMQVLSTIFDFCKRPIVEINFANWLALNKIDLTDYIKQHTDDISSDNEYVKNIEIVKRSNYFLHNPAEKKKFYGWLAAISTLEIVGSIITYCNIENIKILMDNYILQQRFDVANFNWVLIALLVVSFLPEFICEMVYTEKFDKKVKQFYNNIAENE